MTTPGDESADPVARAEELIRLVAIGLATLGPAGWQRLDATFVLAARTQLDFVVFSDDSGRSRQIPPTDEVREHVRGLRELSAQLSDGPWWRMLLRLTSRGEMEVDYDYGDEPFPPEHTLDDEVYRADLELFPRSQVPIWLAARLRGGDGQRRPADLAARQAREDIAAGERGTLSRNDFPALPALWARWAVIASAFVAVGSPWGPRVLPSLGFFEGSRHSGSTLYRLPGGRAVLSGGVWNAPELDAVYNGDAPMPAYYSGAPAWVADQVLNPRAGTGLLTFCYWWEGGSWYRGASPSSEALAEAVPAVWNGDTVVDVVAGLLGPDTSARARAGIATLVTAAEIGIVTRDTLLDVYGDAESFDIDGAFLQLTMAGVALTLPDPLPREEAIATVRRHIEAGGADTTGYPLDELRADRIGVGWMVFVPVEPGEMAIGRAIFYLADDGVLESSTSSVAPSVYIPEFERRFQQRHGAVDA
ncbi:hypothetical protein [Nocardia sp. NPDC058705]|uniref:hypothetical protein n=1 Tax=Nocardia sp. NPDC058705 TaxID=3346609 RepID=UPI0036954821